MGVTFDGAELFSTGPAWVHVGGSSLRHARQRALRGHGERLVSEGITGRSIAQHGTLVADTPAELQAQVDAIESMVDGVPRSLTDELGRTWSNVTMVAFKPAQPVRLGPRWKVDYEIEYVQGVPVR